MNNVNLIGRLTRDVDVRTTSSGKQFALFTIAVPAGKDKTHFIPCVAWDNRATNIKAYFHKGDQIGINGMITSRSYETQEGEKREVIEVNVLGFDFCNSRRESNPETAMQPEKYEAQTGLPFEI